MSKHFVSSRESEYFSERELTSLIGVGKKNWLFMCLKELIDNALDAAEQITAAPEIKIEINERGDLTVSDNGPGIPSRVIDNAMNYSVKVSDKAGRVLPARGQQGHALKILFAVPLVLYGRTDIEIRSQEMLHKITLTRDAAGNPVFDKEVFSDEDVQIGTFFRINKFFYSTLEDDEVFLKCIKLIETFAMVNHHTTFSLKIMDEFFLYERTGDITRWTAENASICRWFDGTQFKEFLRATFNNLGNVPVNQFIAGFHGLKRTAKQKDICNALGIESRDGIEAVLQQEKTDDLLGIMCEMTTPIKPARLGWLNPEHVNTIMGDAAHRKAYGYTDHVRPFTLDVFFREADSYCVDIALNNSVLVDGTLSGPFSSLDSLLHKLRIQYGNKVHLLIHINTPCIIFHSTGKNTAKLDSSVWHDLKAKLKKVTEPWVKKKKAEERDRAMKEKKRAVTYIPAEVKQSSLPLPSDYEGLKQFAETLKSIQAGMDFKSGSRGWCYLLEQFNKLSKSEFSTAESRINLCRKNGLLPLDFTAKDSARKMLCGGRHKSQSTPEQFSKNLIDTMQTEYLSYHPVNMIQFLDYSLVVGVEKIDLIGLFEPVCIKYHLPLFNCRGWSDINSRGDLLYHFKKHHDKGKKCVFLYCGDHDPGGLSISKFFKNNLKQLETAVGFSSDFIEVERFGLNFDFIEKNELSWIDNLDTSNKNYPLDHYKHPDHNKPYVQDYLKKYGARKCEANSLVVAHQAGRQLLEDSIKKYITTDQVEKYKDTLKKEQAKVKAILQEKFAA